MFTRGVTPQGDDIVLKIFVLLFLFLILMFNIYVLSVTNKNIQKKGSGAMKNNIITSLLTMVSTITANTITGVLLSL